MIFIDTSALYALVATEDRFSEKAVSVWDHLIQTANTLITNNYVVTECLTLTQKRLGLEFVRYLQSIILPMLEMDWVDEEQHHTAVQAVLSTNRRSLSLVDCSAFETMRRLEIDTVFTFDEHFREQGYKVVP